MLNGIKYSTSAQTQSLRKGNFWIATGDVAKGPTSISDYWSSITPPSGGYTIYVNKASQGPSISTPINDSQLIFITNRVGAQNFTTVGAALNWYNTQTDKMVFNINYPPIPTSGITFISDIGTTLCYPLTGVTSYSIDPVGNGGFLDYQNGASYISEYGGGFQFDGTNDFAYTNLTAGGGFGINNTAAFTWVIIARSIPANWNSNAGLGANAYGDGTGFTVANTPDSRNVVFYMGSTDGPYTVEIGTITPPNVNTPHMYVISSNGTDLHKGYVDDLSPISSSESITREAARREIFVGRNAYTTSECTNMVSYVQIYYNRQLSDDEVLSLYNAYKGRFTNVYTFFSETDCCGNGFYYYSSSPTIDINSRVFQDITLTTPLVGIFYPSGVGVPCVATTPNAFESDSTGLIISTSVFGPEGGCGCC